MKSLEGFRRYLKSEYKNQDGSEISSKARSDYLSRLNRLDSILGKPIDDFVIIDNAAFESLVADIKSRMTSGKLATSKMRYPYAPYILVLKRYRDYLLTKN